MTDDITLTWRATKFDGSPPEKDDGSCYDGEAGVGRVMKEGYGPQKDLWRWSMTATGFGRDQITTAGREATKDAAKAALEQSYRELVAQNPGNRAYWQEREADVRERVEALARTAS